MTMPVRSGSLLVLLLATTWTAALLAQNGNAEQATGSASETGGAQTTVNAANTTEPVKTNREDAAAVSGGLGSFGQMLPLGRKNLNVQIPSFRNGAPSSLVKASSMTRISDKIMSMESMDIWLYGNNRDEDMRVQLPLADYDLESKVLSSDERSRISRNDFHLEGDHLIFDTVTQQGKMTGRVKMVIFNAASFGNSNTPAETESPDQHGESQAQSQQGGAASNSTATPGKETKPQSNSAKSTANGPQSTSNDQK